jgi:hypothetical protein
VDLFLFGALMLVVLCVGAPFVLPRISRRRWLAATGMALAAVISLACVIGSCVQHVDPGYAAKAYTVTGQQKELSAGYTFLPPWNRIYTLNLKASVFTFNEARPGKGGKRQGDQVHHEP